MYQPQGSAGHVLEILLDGTARTKRDLSHLTGQARTTIAQRLAVLVEAGLVRETAEAAATGGRPSAAFEFDGGSRVILAVDLGSNDATFAVTNLFGDILAHATDPVRVSSGPQVVMGTVVERLDALLRDCSDAPLRVVAIGIGLPGPVDQNSGRPTSPPIMPGWDGFDVRQVLETRYGCPAFVDNDANILAVGERAAAWPDVEDMVYVKIATGIGVGIISGGRLVHGAEGAAGDLGHVYTPAAEGLTCRCGNRGCLEAVAGGLSLAASLSALGVPASTPADIVALVRQGNLDSVRVLREAGRALGEVLAACTALLNPRLIVIGGEIVEVGEPLLAGVRESIYSRALPLASRNLRVAVAQSGPLGGVIGASRMALQRIFSPEHLHSALDRSTAQRVSTPA